MNPTAADLIRHLNLQPLPGEGGWYREIWRGTQTSEGGAQGRSVGTAIYYLLRAGEQSVMHRLPCDEVFHHYAGGAVARKPGGGWWGMGTDGNHGGARIRIPRFGTGTCGGAHRRMGRRRCHIGGGDRGTVWAGLKEPAATEAGPRRGAVAEGLGSR